MSPRKRQSAEGGPGNVGEPWHGMCSVRAPEVLVTGMHGGAKRMREWKQRYHRRVLAFSARGPRLSPIGSGRRCRRCRRHGGELRLLMARVQLADRLPDRVFQYSQLPLNP